ncbi:hypothetical protein, variant [Aphanomyces invadans]|uniref:Carbohydrate kinase PfkB domain-containing protein n=1 Tax=Aphanomyces invadans TaxID=157072 RepID=A0A024TWV7_9STRA|nr:hypothetical protein, variant [Aphanomyces invadans]ETV98439.1 hypothetical protein, variant [Aphanomyces invadans]|eukprot:XP_008872636.1 hypothetical protein, variant [Aphanomyces invadans]
MLRQRMARAIHRWSSQSFVPARTSARALHMKISREVQDALRVGTPVVALESTIVSHGMPYPQNFTMATEVEALIRQHGACPATIAILNGEICVGLSEEQLHSLASFGTQATKCSTRDIAAVIARRGTGATTVSSTMRIAHAAGITVFVTGGIGGVHRYVEDTMDISTDLMELSRTPVAVVCAGVKSILDIPRTLEYLETQAVPVVGYRTRDFPAFFSTTSGGCKAHMQLDSPEDVALLIRTSQDLNLPNGFIVAVPNPAPVDEEMIDKAIREGLAECQAQGVGGNAITPFLLQRVNELTKGESLTSNIALVKNNAVVGAKIARALADRARPLIPPTTASLPTSPRLHSTTPDVVIVGGAVLDVISKPTTQFVRGTSNIGHTKQTWGGVGRNVAECLHRLDVPVLLVSNVGHDSCGDGLLRQLDSLEMDLSGVIAVPNHATATYCAVLTPCGDLDVAIADMTILDNLEWGESVSVKLASARIVVLDGNLSSDKIRQVTEPLAANRRRLLWFEPTSVEKAVRAVESMHRLHVISPNADELRAICNALAESTMATKVAMDDQALAAAAAKLPVRDGLQVVRDIATGELPPSLPRS